MVPMRDSKMYILFWSLGNSDTYIWLGKTATKLTEGFPHTQKWPPAVKASVGAEAGKACFWGARPGCKSSRAGSRPLASLYLSGLCCPRLACTGVTQIFAQ